MSKRIPVYLNEEELKMLMVGLCGDKYMLNLPSSIKLVSDLFDKLEETLEQLTEPESVPRGENES